jgi:serine/threonine-protein kinase
VIAEGVLRERRDRDGSVSEIATLIEGKYDVLAKIREGGMGTIYKVRHRLLEEIRVVKVMKQSIGGDVELKRRFLEEAKTATRLKHPNIATIYDFALGEDGTAYLVMEFIDGVTLGEILKSRGSVGLALSLEIAHQTLLALGYLHRKNVIHRDIAPDNLMLTYDEEGNSQIKMIDLGIAKVLDRRVEMTSTGVFLGKVRYASPEQYGSLLPGEIIDGRSDLYSLGLVLYELLTGHRPFVGDSPLELLRAHVFLDPASFSVTDPAGLVPEGIRAAVLKALQKRREDRFGTAADFDREILALRSRFTRPFDIDPAQAIISLVRDSPVDVTDLVTPSAQDRLNQQFSSGPTPVPPTNPRGTGLSDTAVDVEAKDAKPLRESVARKEAAMAAIVTDIQEKQARLLEEIKERERNRDANGLRTIAGTSPTGSRVEQAARNAIVRIQEEEAREKREAEEEDWRRCESENSEDVWNGYLDRHPESPRREEAVQRLSESRAFREAAETATSQAWSRFGSEWPEGSHRQEAERRAGEARGRENAALAKATGIGTVDSYRAFLKEHPDSYLASQASRYLEEQIAFESARRKDMVRGWQEFASRWPSGRLAANAASALQAAEQRESGALEGALQQGTPRALRKFLAQFQEASGRSRAEAALEESIAFEAAGKEGKAGWEQFLESYPDGRHNSDARTALRELRGKEAEEERRRGESKLLLEIRSFEEAGRQADLESLAEKYSNNETIAAASRAAVGRLQEARRREKAEQEAREALRLGLEAEQKRREVEQHERESERLRELEARREREAAEQRQREAEERERAAAKQRELEAKQQLDEAKRLQREAEERKREEAARQQREAREREREAAKRQELETKREREEAKRFQREAEERKREEARRQELEAKGKREEAARQQREAEEGERQASKQRELEAKREREEARRLQREKEQLERAAGGASGEAADRTRRSVGLAAGVLIAAAGVWIAIHRASKPNAEDETPASAVSVEPTPAPNPSSLSKVPQALPGPVAPAGAGTLVIDAFPWGEVVRVEDSKGKNWLSGKQAYTPMVLELPPGKYSVVMKNVNFPGRTISISAAIAEGASERCVGSFEPINPAAYFEMEGRR